MMMITRTGQLIEIGLGSKTLSIETDGIEAASLTVERAAEGGVANALIIVSYGAAKPTRIHGSLATLSEIHRCIVETMQEGGSASAPQGTAPAGRVAQQPATYF